MGSCNMWSFWLASFFSSVSQVHLCCSVTVLHSSSWLNSIPLYGYTIFYLSIIGHLGCIYFLPVWTQLLWASIGTHCVGIRVYPSRVCPWHGRAGCVVLSQWWTNTWPLEELSDCSPGKLHHSASFPAVYNNSSFPRSSATLQSVFLAVA